MRVEKLPYPQTIDAAATLAVESAFQKLGAAGAFEGVDGLSESAMIFGKACAYEAIIRITEEAREYAASIKGGSGNG